MSPDWLISAVVDISDVNVEMAWGVVALCTGDVGVHIAGGDSSHSESSVLVLSMAST